MDLEFTAEETAFRDEVQAFLAAQLPAALSDKVLRGRPLTRGHGWLARRAEPARLAGQPLAGGVRRHRLEQHAEVHLR